MKQLNEVVYDLTVVAETLDIEHPDLANRLDIIVSSLEIQADSIGTRIRHWIIDQAKIFTIRSIGFFFKRYVVTLVLHVMPFVWNSYLDWTSQHPDEKMGWGGPDGFATLLRMAFTEGFERTDLAKPIEKIFTSTIEQEAEPTGLYEGVELIERMEMEKQRKIKDKEQRDLARIQQEKRKFDIDQAPREMELKRMEQERKEDQERSKARSHEREQQRQNDAEATKQRRHEQEMMHARDKLEQNIRQYEQDKRNYEAKQRQQAADLDSLKRKIEYTEKTIELEKRTKGTSSHQLNREIDFLRKEQRTLSDLYNSDQRSINEADAYIQKNRRELDNLKRDLEDARAKIDDLERNAFVITAAQRKKIAPILRKKALPPLIVEYRVILNRIADRVCRDKKMQVYIERQDKRGLSRFLISALQQGIDKEQRSFSKATHNAFKKAGKEVKI